VPIVGASLTDQIDRTADDAAVLGLHNAAHDLHFFHAFNAHDVHVVATAVILESASFGGHRIRIGAVDRNAGAALAEAIDADAAITGVDAAR
jgi:lipoprotein signal peptidase